MSQMQTEEKVHTSAWKRILFSDILDDKKEAKKI